VTEICGTLSADQPLFIGGKSMGGRVASLIADDVNAQGRVRGLVCLGYPFHPPGKPDVLRTAHLQCLACPALIVQGERDPFGTRDEVATYTLSNAITLEWLPDANHDFKPRAKSGVTHDENFACGCAFCYAGIGDDPSVGWAEVSPKPNGSRHVPILSVATGTGVERRKLWGFSKWLSPTYGLCQ
jgi:hypothetical protein